MKLEAGKFYKTRGGRKAFCVGILAENPFGETDSARARIYIEGHTNGPLCHYEADGRSWIGHDADDLVEEWKEPKRIKGRLIIWNDGEGRYIPDGNRDCYHSYGRVASIKVDVLEGEGL